METSRVTVVRPRDRQLTPPTPGMVREAAFVDGDRWSGFVTTESGMVSGWHHHSGWDTYVYVLSGTLKLEFGPGGADTVEAQVGDFLHVPAGLVHREGNPSGEAADIVVFRVGHGEIVVNVDGPDPAG